MRTHEDELPDVVTKLTEDEHNTRATLLGRWYDHKDNTYNVRNKPVDMLDADTLEPITIGESNKRQRIYAKFGEK